MKLSKIKLNPDNPRIIKDDKFLKLVNSILCFPQMLEKRRLVCVTDTDKKIFPLGGNMRYNALLEIASMGREAVLNYLQKFGKEENIILLEPLFKGEIQDSWVEMADEWTEEQRKEFIIKDNVSFGEWDFDTLANEWNVEELAEWCLDIPNFEIDEEEDEDEVNEQDLFDIELPFYTPSKTLPNLKDLADIKRTNTLNSKIDLLKIDEELKEILKIRASFFTDFNFQKIADYYAQQTDEVKELFEELGMVILAPQEALKRGFINLKNKIIDE